MSVAATAASRAWYVLNTASNGATGIYANFTSNDVEGSRAMDFHGDAAFYQDALGGDFGGSINPLFFESFPSVEYDTWWTLGAYGDRGDIDGP